MIAYCGLNCSRCDARLATLENSNVKREATARKWSRLYKAEILPEQIQCDGCKSNGEKFFHCNHCKIRKCCASKDVAHCAACDEYICKILGDFIKLAPEAGMALENLRSPQEQ